MVTNKTIGDEEVSVVPWGFLDLMKTKRKLLELVSGLPAESIDLLDMLDNENDEVNVDPETIVKVVRGIVETLDEKTLQWFIKKMLEGVSFGNNNLNDPQTRDNVLRANSVLFYKIVGFVLEVNFGDFLAHLKTNSESTVSTENE